MNVSMCVCVWGIWGPFSVFNSIIVGLCTLNVQHVPSHLNVHRKRQLKDKYFPHFKTNFHTVYKETIFNLHGQSRDDVPVRWASWFRWLMLKPRPILRRSRLFQREEREHRRQEEQGCCRGEVGSWCSDHFSCHLNLLCFQDLPFDEPHWMIASTLLQMGIWPKFLN